VHRLDRREVLVDDRVDRAAALFDVAADPAAQAHVGGGVHEDLDVHLGAELRVLEDQDALDHDDLARLDAQHLVRPVVDRVVVSRALDGQALFELAQVFDHHVRVECVRVVVIEKAPLLERQLVVPLVVVVVAQNRDVVAEAIDQRPHERRLAAAGAAGHTDHNGIHSALLSPRRRR